MIKGAISRTAFGTCGETRPASMLSPGAVVIPGSPDPRNSPRAASKGWSADDTVRRATTPEVREPRAKAAALKKVVAGLALENRLPKKA